MDRYAMDLYAFERLIQGDHGSFVQSLAKAFREADEENYERLTMAFPRCAYIMEFGKEWGFNHEPPEARTWKGVTRDSGKLV